MDEADTDFLNGRVVTGVESDNQRNVALLRKLSPQKHDAFEGSVLVSELEHLMQYKLE